MDVPSADNTALLLWLYEEDAADDVDRMPFADVVVVVQVRTYFDVGAVDGQRNYFLSAPHRSRPQTFLPAEETLLDYRHIFSLVVVSL